MNLLLFCKCLFQGVQLRINIQQFLKTYFVVILLYWYIWECIEACLKMFKTAKMDAKAL